ncbi:MAG: C2H2-type zinc finger protein [Deltaproteobacteria bacterium]|nr:C2H2-type zinc finger protein [Deltaproteobacteria bacterium]
MYTCPYCGAVFSTKQGLGGHVRWKHRAVTEAQRREARLATREARKRKAIAMGTMVPHLACPLCGLSRVAHRLPSSPPLDGYAYQARYTYGRGSGYFINEEESVKWAELKEKAPELYERYKMLVAELSAFFSQ